MADFVGRDPRGYCVVLDGGSWAHALEHHSDFNGSIRLAFGALTNPTYIFDNQSSGRVIRTGSERYLLRIDGSKFLVVPVRILSEPEQIAGYGNVPVGTRSSVTVHTSDGLPRGNIIWRST